MDALPSLTRAEALERSALIEVDRYDIDVDLTDMLEGADFRAVCTVRFSCRTPGATTFVDAALTIVSATLNGVAIRDDQISTGRIQLTDLAADNILVVESVQSATAASEWVHRSVDRSDKEVYVWTSFEPDDARRAWACFDQPDLKAPHGFTVLAPVDWMVVSNSGDAVVTRDDSGGRRWQFPDTPSAVDVRPRDHRGAVLRNPFRAGRVRPRPAVPGGRSRGSSTATLRSCSS